jgi:protein YIPF1/2
MASISISPVCALPFHLPPPTRLIINPTDFTNPPNARKIQPDSTPFLSSNTNPATLPNDATTPQGKRMLWTISFYAQFFDVDTTTVLHRCRTALIPFLPATPPFLDTLDGNPDLYGPFWVATTVVVILFLTGTISQKLASEGKAHFEYDFKLLSGAAGLIYGYTLFVPLGLWAALRWFGAQGLELVECWALYGYGNLFWIIVALLSWSPLNALNYVLVGVGFAVSAFFLLKNLYPVISATDMKVSKGLLVAVVVLHAGMAVAIKVLFFSHGSPAKSGGGGDGNTIGGGGDAAGGDGDAAGRMFRF